MSRAQDIRQARSAKLEEYYEAEAKKIFDWILDIFDFDIKNNSFGWVEVFLFYDETSILSGKYEMEYELKEFHGDRKRLFETLKKIVEQEEGYKALLKIDTKIWGERAILIRIDIV